MSYNEDAHGQRLSAQVHRTSRTHISDEVWIHGIHRRGCGVDLWDPPFIARRHANADAYRLAHPFVLSDLAQVIHQYVEASKPNQPVRGGRNGDDVAELRDELDALLAA